MRLPRVGLVAVEDPFRGIRGRRPILDAAISIAFHEHLRGEDEVVERAALIEVTYSPRARRVETHPCHIPDGEAEHTGEKCPKTEEVDEGASRRGG